MIELLQQIRQLIASMYSTGEIDTATASELAQRCNKVQKGGMQNERNTFNTRESGLG